MVVPVPAAGDRVLVKPWICTEADINWMHDLGSRRYPQRFDSISTEQWFRNVVMKQPLLFYPARTENAYCISMLGLLPWLPTEVECNVVFICTEPGFMWEGIHCLRASIDWAKSRRCKLWRISSDTDYDLRAIALRLGATEVSPRFELRFF